MKELERAKDDIYSSTYGMELKNSMVTALSAVNKEIKDMEKSFTEAFGDTNKEVEEMKKTFSNAFEIADRKIKNMETVMVIQGIAIIILGIAHIL